MKNYCLSRADLVSYVGNILWKLTEHKSHEYYQEKWTWKCYCELQDFKGKCNITTIAFGEDVKSSLFGITLWL